MEVINFSKSLHSSAELKKNWLKVDLQPTKLVIQKTNLVKISKDAFNSEHFTSLLVLRLWDSPISEVSDGAFNGLKNLKKLSFNDNKLHKFEGIVLAGTPNLEFFTMRKCGGPKLYVDNIFGSVPMHHLKHVIIEHCNLGDTITKNTFSGLHNIFELELMSSEITKIGPQSFDIALESLSSLRLRLNKLKSIPADLFIARKEENIIIDLFGNPWHCDCQLEGLRNLILADVVENKILCESPSEFTDHLLGQCPPLCETKSKEQPTLPPIRIPSGDELIEYPKIQEDSIQSPEMIQLNKYTHKYDDNLEDGYESDSENEDGHEEVRKPKNKINRKSGKNRQTENGEEQNKKNSQYEKWQENKGYNSDEFQDEEEKDPANVSEYNYEYDSLYGDEYDDERKGHRVDEPKNELEEEHDHDRVILQCVEPTKIKVALKIPQMGMISIRVADENLYLTAENLTENNLLIGFRYNTRPDSAVKCLGSFEGRNDHAEIEFNLKPNKIYQFCRMKRDFSVTELLDCIMYHSNGETEDFDAWWFTDSKPAVIGGGIGLAVFVFLFGILMSKILARIFPRRIRGTRIVEKENIVVEKPRQIMMPRTMQEQEFIRRLR